MGQTMAGWNGLAFGCALALAGAGAAFAAEPAGDETFEGTFSCLKPSSAADKSPILCQSQINPGLPVFDLSLVWHEDARHLRVLDRIEISRAGEKQPFQTVTGLRSVLPPETENGGLEMLDLNFDGFLDMRVLRHTPSGEDRSYQNWLWSTEAGQYVAAPGLDDIASPSFDAENEEIVSHWRSGSGESGTDVYSYEGMTPVLVHREADRTGAGGACERTFYDRIDDQLKKTGTGACQSE